MPEEISKIENELENLSQELFGLPAARWGFSEDIGYYARRKKALEQTLYARNLISSIEAADSVEKLKTIIKEIIEIIFGDAAENLKFSRRLADQIHNQGIKTRIFKEIEQMNPPTAVCESE